jgi:hypothetical protein
MKETAAQRVLELVPDTIRHVEGYATEALDVRRTIVDQMQRLTPVQYEGILRPAFRQDEWKLIAVGAIIGFLVGELQVVLLLH